jgi:hypothetical protein
VKRSRLGRRGEGRGGGEDVKRCKADVCRACSRVSRHLICGDNVKVSVNWEEEISVQAARLPRSI